jgi:hypothetical protein
MTKRKKPSLWFYLLIALIAIFVLAVGVLRHDETSTDNASPLTNLASSAFMVICTLGPGILAKELFKVLIPVEALARNSHRVRKEIREAQRAQAQAIAKLDQLILNREWHKQESQRITSTYLLAYREAGGKVPTIPTPHAAPPIEAAPGAVRSFPNPYRS